ncbi:hypothetical protein [Herbiconiux daphne]|uniref:Uncharacterized protein n=1 Tax=Herbiconiux daphne TaxID=2970914 RepID=A0ABT2GY42_9MICO|nr:hypothetical protein [Herbiconiux daphne]MCS5732781.1 hypothetical protein [Herbiconiux daphne]
MAALSPGRREAVREVVLDARRRGCVDDRARAYLRRVTGADVIADLVAEALAAEQPRAIP